jgi:hypothetical protein
MAWRGLANDSPQIRLIRAEAGGARSAVGTLVNLLDAVSEHRTVTWFAGSGIREFIRVMIHFISARGAFHLAC